MSSIPANLARVPSFLASRFALGSIGRTNGSLLRVQEQLASGVAISRVSDDPVRATGVLSINERLARVTQQKQNLSQAEAVLGGLDQALGNANDLVLRAREIASTQIGLLSDPSQRRAMLSEIDTIIEQMVREGNTQVMGLHVFGGSTPGTEPITRMGGGFRYMGQGMGFTPDLGLGEVVPVTLGGANALGEVSSRQQAAAVLSPNLAPGTQVGDLRGARGLGVTPGSVTMRFNAGVSVTVDLSGAASMADVQAQLNGAIRQYETDNSVTILGPGGVSLNGQALRIDVAGGALTFVDAGTSTTGADLGLTQATFTGADPLGENLSPRLTLQTALASVPGLTLPLGTIRLRLTGGGQGLAVRDVDLSGAQTLDQVRGLIESADMGARVRVNQAGDGIEVYNEISGRTLSVEEVADAGNVRSATELGIRTLHAGLSLNAFNGGRGVQVVDGVLNPTTGVADPDKNTDLRVTLGNGQYFDVDLRPQDVVSVQTVLDRINQQFAAAVGTQNNPSAPALGAGQFSAALGDGANGLALSQGVGPGAIKVGVLNNSGAAEQLGLLSLTPDAASGAYVGEDRSGLKVSNVLTALVDLREALLSSSSSGITLAGEDLGQAMERLTTARGLVGGYDRRVQDQLERLTDQTVLDEKVRSTLQDTDYAEAATRLSQLNTQLEASLATTARLQGRTLFDFLG
jgi:flagellin-like hook-associated protein FlgL